MSESTRAVAREQALVMLAFADGAEIEFRYRGMAVEKWYPIEEPVWDWFVCEFRVRKKEEKQP